MGLISEGEIIFIITRFLSGEADKEEVVQLEEWIHLSESNMNFFHQIRNIWEAAGKDTYKVIPDTEKALKSVYSKIKVREMPLKKVWSVWQKIAAILVIPLLSANILWFMLHNKSDTDTKNYEPVYNELYAAFGTRSALKLSDSTLVWLNSGSSIRYPDKFIGEKRTVYLNGEAYFEVKSDSVHPFIVQTSALNIEAIGTEFSVSDYKNSELSEVSLVSGKVIVNRPEIGGPDETIVKLDTCQHFIYNSKTLKSSVSVEDTYKYISWKDGKLIFRNDPMSEVVRKIGQVFNIDIELRGAELQNYRYRATFQDESLNEILKLLKLSSPIDYCEVKRMPLHDGSFPRKKVIISPSK